MSVETEQPLSSHWQFARAAWPNLNVTEAAFAAYLKAHSPALCALPALAHCGDLYLACACAGGDRSAHAAFVAKYSECVRAVLRRRGLDDGAVADVQQTVFAKLLLTEPGGIPRIAEYRGRASLKSWVCRVALTSWFMSRRSEGRRREQPGDADALVDQVFEHGPELGYIKQHYRAAVEAAIVSALGRLPDRDRVLLRLSLSERMSIDRLGVMYQVNRATAARWLVRARRKLLELTRNEIQLSLKVNERDCDSILNLVQTQLDISVARHLETSVS